jgi:HPt (histidine-containing phosphotransfer) domain-containing protein
MSQLPDSPASTLQAMLQTLWKSNFATILDRLKALRAAQSKLVAGSLDSETRQAAESAAHKLAGVLGTFGLPEGSQLASRAEALFAENTPFHPENAAELAELLDQLETVITSKAQ